MPVEEPQLYPRNAKSVATGISASFLAAVSIAVGFVGTGIGYSSSVRSTPPVFLDIWGLAWLFSVGSILSGLFASRLGKGLVIRLLASIGVLTSVFAAWAPFCNYQENFNDYPWFAVSIIGALSIGGSLFCNLRPVGFGLSIAALIWLLPGISCSQGSTELKTVSDGLRVSVDQAPGNQFTVNVVDSMTGKLASNVDYLNVNPAGRAGMFISIYCQQWGDWGRFRAHVPPWLRKWDVGVTVPIFPQKGDAELVVPSVNSRGTYEVKRNGAFLKVEIREESEGYVSAVLNQDGEVELTPRIRFLNQEGKAIPVKFQSIRGNREGTELRARIPADAGPNIRIAAFNESSMRFRTVWLRGFNSS